MSFEKVRGFNGDVAVTSEERLCHRKIYLFSNIVELKKAEH